MQSFWGISRKVIVGSKPQTQRAMLGSGARIIVWQDQKGRCKPADKDCSLVEAVLHYLRRTLRLKRKDCAVHCLALYQPYNGRTLGMGPLGFAATVDSRVRRDNKRAAAAHARSDPPCRPIRDGTNKIVLKMGIPLCCARLFVAEHLADQERTVACHHGN